MNFKTNLGEYRPIQTEDGQITLYSSLYDENCHSTSGALEETLYNYIQGCDVINRANISPITILEIGLGVGLGVLCTFEQTRNCHFPIKFISTEIDPGLVKWVFEQEQFKAIKSDEVMTNESYRAKLGDNFEIEVLIGDARKTLKNIDLEDKIDCIFQDAFSPQKNGSLWTKEWFKNLRSLCGNNSVMTTYSAAVKIRKAMLDAGFFVTNMKGFGNKRSATRAYTNIEFRDLELEDTLTRSKTPPLSDKDLE